MARDSGKRLVYEKIKRYIEELERNQIKVWRLYLYGSYAKGTHTADSDIDLAVFLDKDDIDGFEEDVQLMRLRWNIDVKIEPHSFARPDFDEANPYIKEITETGERII